MTNFLSLGSVESYKPFGFPFWDYLQVFAKSIIQMLTILITGSRSFCKFKRVASSGNIKSLHIISSWRSLKWWTQVQQEMWDLGQNLEKFLYWRVALLVWLYNIKEVLEHNKISVVEYLLSCVTLSQYFKKEYWNKRVLLQKPHNQLHRSSIRHIFDFALHLGNLALQTALR